MRIYPAGEIGNDLLGYRETRSNNGYLGQDDPVLHFGLGANQSVDIKVTFLQGTEIVQNDISANQTILIDASGEADKIRILSPNGGEVLSAGILKTIEWLTNGAVGLVKIEYSSDNGISWLEIIDSITNTDRYSWQVPDLLSVNGLIRISDVNDNTITDNSDFVFSVTGSSLTLTRPNGGERWIVGSSQAIRWQSTGTIGPVRLEYSTDGGVSWFEIVNSTSNDNSFSWTVPDTVSESCLVRISDVADGEPFDVSNSLFSIQSGPPPEIGTMRIAINCDDEYQLWVNGVHVGDNIEWSAAQNYRVPALLGRNELAVLCVNTGGPGGLIAEVRIDGILFLVTDGSWRRAGGLLQGWNSVGYDDSGWELAVNHGSYGIDPWGYQIAGFPSASNANWIWSEEKTDAGELYLRGGFTVGPQEPFLELSVPNGGEEWQVGNAHQVRWTSVGSINAVRLEYSTDGGAGWLEIVSSTNNDGSYSWTVPDAISDNCLVRISDAADGEPFDESNGVFSIKPEVVIVPGDLEITINCDDEYQLWVNGQFVGENTLWSEAKTYDVPALSGKNVLAVFAKNIGGPGGLIAQVSVDGAIVIETDNTWRRSLGALQPAWIDLYYDDSGWDTAIEHGSYGIDPWGRWILGFPNNSNAQWVWNEDIRDVVQKEWYFRGSFNLNFLKNVQNQGNIEKDIMPDRFALLQNYPNPFNSETIIQYQIPSSEHVIIKIYDIVGQEIQILTNEKKEPGFYQIIWNGTNNQGSEISSGIYIAVIIAGNYAENIKLILLH